MNISCNSTGKRSIINITFKVCYTHGQLEYMNQVNVRLVFETYIMKNTYFLTEVPISVVDSVFEYSTKENLFSQKACTRGKDTGPYDIFR